MYVENKVALITGAVSGLGLSFAREFLKNGIRGVCLMDVNEQVAQEIIPSLEDEYGQNKVTFIKGDVTNDAEFENAFKKTVEIFGNIDILINNAGIGDELNYKKRIDINLIGVLRGTVLAFEKYLQKYKTAENPVIVNISSIYGLESCPFAFAYTAAKHGVIAIGKSFSCKPHYEATGIKIISICPGFTTTPLTTTNTDTAVSPKYIELLKEAFDKAVFQSPEAVSRSLVKILDNCGTGDVWVVEEDKCYQVEVPHRSSLKTLRTLEI